MKNESVNKEIISFSIVRYSMLNNDGVVEGVLPESITDTQSVIKAYESMVLGRAFDKKAIALQRTGKLGT